MSFTLPSSQKADLLNQYKPQIEQVLNRVLDRGGQGDVIVNASQAFSLSANSGQIDQYKVTSSQVLGLRLIHQNLIPACIDDVTRGPRRDYEGTKAYCC